MITWPAGSSWFPCLEGGGGYARFDIDDFQSEYKTAHESGDRGAIFEFAKDDREAISRDWVIRQLVAWRLSDSTEGKRQFDRFMRAYWSQQGKRTHRTMMEIIRRDQNVYKDFVHRDRTLSIKAVQIELARTHRIGLNSVKDVLKHYRKVYASWKTSRSTRVWRSLRPSPITPSPR